MLWSTLYQLFSFPQKKFNIYRFSSSKYSFRVFYEKRTFSVALARYQKYIKCQKNFVKLLIRERPNCINEGLLVRSKSYRNGTMKACWEVIVKPNQTVRNWSKLLITRSLSAKNGFSRIYFRKIWFKS